MQPFDSLDDIAREDAAHEATRTHGKSARVIGFGLATHNGFERRSNASGEAIGHASERDAIITGGE